MRRNAFSLLDLLVALALLTLLVYLVRLDWRRPDQHGQGVAVVQLAG